MNNPNKTASGKYNYSTIYFNKRIEDWVPLIHNNVNIINSWRKIEIKKYNYGYDNYVYILSKLLPYIKQNKDDIFIYIGNMLNIEKYAKKAFKAHIKNYLYWRNHIPYEENKIYEKPSKSRKNKKFSDELAVTDWKSLDTEQKEIYIDIVKTIFDYLKNIIIMEGIQNLKLDD